ncbi:DedA family protein [Catalinimonas sp. 4WD22]|uniref:DedA family protein n=1 Tax=Catalinimonas locisalis TaxID=3133978 RepID=UPI003101A5F6
MIDIILNVAEWLNPENILTQGGFGLLLLIVFLETGVFFGFFLPGDSLLLTAGLLCGSPYLDVSVSELFLGVAAAAFLGSMMGYVMGKSTGSFLLRKKDSFFFKKKYLSIAESYYLRYGNISFVIGKFLPVARTFLPIIAGLVKSDIGKFMFFNILGSASWTTAFVIGGYYLNKIFPSLVNYIEFIILLLFIITAIPLLITWSKKKKIARAESVNAGT